MSASVSGELWMKTLPSVAVKGKGADFVFLLLKSANPKGKDLKRSRLALRVGWKKVFRFVIKGILGR